jgi:hypothetical protein
MVGMGYWMRGRRVTYNKSSDPWAAYLCRFFDGDPASWKCALGYGF